jgi:hypothetical protein
MIAIIVIILLFIIIKHYSSFTNTGNIEMVVSRYNEDLEWLKKKPFNKLPVIIYNKGINDNFYKPPLLKKIVKLDNVGVCIHTYLYHIITEYNNLADITIFLPGSCTCRHKKKHTIETVNKTIKTQNSVFYVLDIEPSVSEFTLDKYTLADPKNRSLNNDNNMVKCDPRPFGIWYDKLFHGIKLEYWSRWTIFSVSRKDILNRSKESYEELIQYVNKNKNEECAHYFERAFLSVFYPIDKKCLFK